MDTLTTSTRGLMRAAAHTFVVACAAALSAGLLLPVALSSAPAAAEPGDNPEFGRVLGSIPSASEALANVKDVVAGRAPAEDLTLALRDLSLRLPEYSGENRVLANGFLARPNGGNRRFDPLGAVWSGSEAGKSCSPAPKICVHWTTSGDDAPPPADVSPANGVPDQVDATLAAMVHVWGEEVGTYGFQKPLGDKRASKDAGNGFDVYLSDIGNNGLYGYCAPDDKRIYNKYRYFDLAGYCVLDEDYAEFTGHTALQNLQVTAAHEFFHAIQFGYDAAEDPWFMEGTAAWIEDEVYPDVNDNWQYLKSSQMRQPDRPLDTSDGFTVYGSWGFFRNLSERFGRDVILHAWQRSDGSPTGPDDYSLLGVRRAIEAEGSKLGTVFGDYARDNLAPAEYYDEGGNYPAPSVGSKMLGGSSRSTGWLNTRIDHMAIAYRSAKPNAHAGLGAMLRVTVDSPARKTGPQARVLVKHADGSFDSRKVTLDRSGYGTVKVDFGRNSVNRVYVALVNASDSFRKCYSGKTQYSCGGGVPRDNNRRFSVRFALA